MDEYLTFTYQDLVFRTVSRTSGSVAFVIKSSGSSLGKGSIVGWLDVHYPCHEHIKVRIRGALPKRFLSHRFLCELTQTVYEALKIPATETYEVLYFQMENGIEMTQPVNNDGITDRIQTSRKFNLDKR